MLPCTTEHRLPFDLRVAVSHRDRRLFVAARQQLGELVVAVVDDRFVKAFEARARIGGDVLEAERLDHVDHEVRAGPFHDARRGAARRWFGVGRQLSVGRRGRARARRARFLRLGRDRRRLRDQSGRARSCAFQKSTTTEGILSRVRHGVSPPTFAREVYRDFSFLGPPIRLQFATSDMAVQGVIMNDDRAKGRGQRAPLKTVPFAFCPLPSLCSSEIACRC